MSDTEVNPSNPIEGEFLSGKEMMELERERIRSSDRRNDVALRAIEANDAADKRQFEFHMARQEQDLIVKKEQIKMMKYLVIGGSITSLLIFSVLGYMLFFGSEHQSQIASKAIETIVSALGGIGIFLFGKSAIGKMLNNQSE